MVQRTKNQNELYVGLWSADCDRCGFKFKNVDLRKEWNGLYTCRDCWEPKHPSYFQGQIDYSDNPQVPWTRPTSMPATVEYVADAGKTLTTTNTDIQEWNTELTNGRVVILPTNAQKGDQFIIYKTVDDDNSLTFVSTLRDSGTTV